jgi:exodeoxyribonuclease-3|tara:strand:+ start:243 stop:1025 length:783 start_codon:yes stop_codon:yes gene_type:complete
MKIATWNVNSVRVRLPHVIDWLKISNCDVLLLQETKTVNETFPSSEFESINYKVAIVGQKSYNGVAVISKFPTKILETSLPGDKKDSQARYLEVSIQEKKNKIRLGSIYLPNGNPINTDKFTYKISWMDRLIEHAKKLIENEEITILAGDYNVIPEEIDVYDPAGWEKDALFHPTTRSKYREILNLGFYSSIRLIHPGKKIFSYWDYFAGSFQKNKGLLIDHILLSPQACDKLIDSGIDTSPREKDKPSDHTPVWCSLRF